MARSLWSGTISFGLVSIPVRMVSATQSKELRFHFLDKHDLQPISYDKVRRDTGEHVDSDDIVRGFEVEKGRFVPLEDEDLDRLDIELTKTIDICDFVDLDEIDPIYFRKAYYLEPQEGAVHGGGRGRGPGLDGLAGDLPNRERRATSRIAIHLGQHHAGERELLVELVGGLDGILPGHAVHHKKDLLRVDGIFDIGHLVHHGFINGQPARSIDDDDVFIFCPAFTDGILRDLYRVLVFFFNVHVHANLLAQYA